MIEEGDQKNAGGGAGMALGPGGFMVTRRRMIVARAALAMSVVVGFASIVVAVIAVVTGDTSPWLFVGGAAIYPFVGFYAYMLILERGVRDQMYPHR